MLIQFLTGIGVLIYSVSVMSVGFERICGNRIRQSVSKYSTSKYRNTFFGMLIIFVLQSSTASVTLVSGLAGIGVVTVLQSVCLIIGTNIGSAINTIIVSFQDINIVAYFGLLVVIGIFIKIFAKNNTLKNFATVFCGIGLLFVGLSLMSSSSKEIAATPQFMDFFYSINNGFMLFVIGLALATLVNSSLGSMAILTSVIAVSGGAISMQAVAFFIFGMNIGTGIMPVLITLAQKNRNALIASLSNLVFNIIGTLLFLPFMFIPWVEPATAWVGSVTLQLILINIIFNTATSIVLVPLAKQFTALLSFMVKDKKQTETVAEKVSETPIIGLLQLNNNALTLFHESLDKLETAMLYSNSEAVDNIEQIIESLDALNEQSREMNLNILKIEGGLSKNDELLKRNLANAFVGIEKTNVNIIKLIKACKYKDKKVKFENEQKRVLTNLQKIMLENLHDMKQVSYEVLYQKDSVESRALENIMKKLEKVVKIKIKAKKSIIQEKVANHQITKYSCFLNVINYYEQVNTNLTDIILNIITD